MRQSLRGIGTHLAVFLAFAGPLPDAAAGSDIGSLNPCLRCSSGSVTLTPSNPGVGVPFDVDVDFTATLACPSGPLHMNISEPSIYMSVPGLCSDTDQPSHYHYHATVPGQSAGQYQVVGALEVVSDFIPPEYGIAGAPLIVGATAAIPAPASGAAAIACLIALLAGIALHRQRRARSG